MSGTWSFSSNFCCLLSSVSIQWWQQRIFSSSFSSSRDVTLLKLLMLPLLEPIPLLLPPPVGGDWEWTGLPDTHRASRVPLISFSVNRSKANHFSGRGHKTTRFLVEISYTLQEVCSYARARGKGTNSMHFLHMMDPQRRQWCRLFRMLNLFPQSGQNGTSESFTHETTDFSMATKKNCH